MNRISAARPLRWLINCMFYWVSDTSTASLYFLVSCQALVTATVTSILRMKQKVLKLIATSWMRTVQLKRAENKLGCNLNDFCSLQASFINAAASNWMPFIWMRMNLELRYRDGYWKKIFLYLIFPDSIKRP